MYCVLLISLFFNESLTRDNPFNFESTEHELSKSDGYEVY